MSISYDGTGQAAELEGLGYGQPVSASVSLSIVERDPAAAFIATILPLVPGWECVTKSSEFQVERLSGAMTNFVFRVWKVSIQGEVDINSRLIVRVYGKGNLLFSRRQEHGVFLAACRLGLGPQCLLQFANGRVEECLPGIPLQAASMRVPAVSQAIARALADFHVGMYESLSFVRDLSGPAGSSPRTDDTGEENAIWSRLEHWLRLAIKMNDGELRKVLDVSRIVNDIQFLRDSQKGAEMEYFGFCHNDLQYGNILIMEEEISLHHGHDEIIGRKNDVLVKLIDYEYCGVGDIAYDVSNHFCEWAADYHATAEPSGFALDWTRMPTDSERYHFCRAYVQQIILNHCDSRLACSLMSHYSLDEAVHNLAERAKAYEPISHLMWGLWGVVQSSCSEVNFDYSRYAKLRFQRYYTSLQKVLQYS